MPPTLGAGPLLAIAAGAIALVIWFRLHAFLTLILVSLLTALVTRIPVEVIVDSLVEAFGDTLGNVALLIALGAMLGKLVEHSGGATVLAEKMVNLFGEKSWSRSSLPYPSGTCGASSWGGG